MNKLKKLRTAKKLTLEKLSELSNVPISSINSYEQGVEPGLDPAIKLAKALGVTVEELAEEEYPKTKPEPMRLREKPGKYNLD